MERTEGGRVKWIEREKKVWKGASDTGWASFSLFFLFTFTPFTFFNGHLLPLYPFVLYIHLSSAQFIMIRIKRSIYISPCMFL